MRSILEAERAVGYPPLAARATRILGNSLEDLGRPAEAREALISAQRLAERASDVRLATHVMLDLLRVVGVKEDRYGDAHLLGQMIEAALERVEMRGDPDARVRLLQQLGNLASEERYEDRAIELQREVLAVRRRDRPLVLSEVARAENNLANAFASSERYDEALPHFLEALDLRRRIYGEEHPLTAAMRMNLGMMLTESGDQDEARTQLLAAQAALRKVPKSESYPVCLATLGVVEDRLGNYAEARTYYEAALELKTRRLGPDHPSTAQTPANLGALFLEAGEPARALSLHRRALAVYEKTVGKSHPSYAVALVNVGEDLRHLHHPAEALKYQREAIQIFRARRGKDSPITGYPLAYQGLALLDLGRRREAVPFLEQALNRLSAADIDRAMAAFGLARALDPRRPTSLRSEALAREALAIFTALHHNRERKEVVSYLAQAHRGGRRPH